MDMTENTITSHHMRNLRETEKPVTCSNHVSLGVLPTYLDQHSWEMLTSGNF